MSLMSLFATKLTSRKQPKSRKLPQNKREPREKRAQVTTAAAGASTSNHHKWWAFGLHEWLILVTVRKMPEARYDPSGILEVGERFNSFFVPEKMDRK